MGMVLHSSPSPPPPPPTTTTAAGKKLWNVLRIAFFMMRKGFTSKRKLIMDVNLMMQRGKLRLGKSFGNNLTFPSNAHGAGAAFGLREYEFSCTNSPNPAFPKRKHSYFPCMGGGTVYEEEPDAVLGPAAVVTKSTSPILPSPFSVRVSNYSVAEEGDDGVGGEVDDRAEEFIRKFYQQLNTQGQIQLLQYPED